MTDLTEERVLTWERHGSSIFSAIAIILMAWIGSSVVTMKEDIAVMKVKVSDALEIRDTLSSVKEQHIKLFMRMDSIDAKLEEFEDRENGEKHNGSR